MFESKASAVASITSVISAMDTLPGLRDWFGDAAARVALGDGVLPVVAAYRGVRRLIDV